MKAKTFENLIRKVVREEIDYSLRREIKNLKEDLRENIKPSIVEHTERKAEVPTNVKSSLREKIMGTQPIKPKQNFTANGALNDLLNETAQGSTNTESSQSPEMSVESMPAPLQDIVNRDYRGLMQAIDKKKGK